MAENSGSERKNGRGRPFQKGQSGNPGGVPRIALRAKSEWMEFMEGLHENTGKTRRLVLLERYFEIAREGEPSVLKDAIARTHGKVPDRVEVIHGDIELDWGDADVPDAVSASAAASDSEESSEVQGGDLRPEVGEDSPRGSDDDG